MTKVIKFPNDNFRKNSRQVVAFSGSKNKFTVGLSIAALVLSLSIFNNKVGSSDSSPTRGMRGLASVDNSQFNVDTDKIIKLIESKNSRKIMRLGRNPSAIDKLGLSPTIVENYLVEREAGRIKRISLTPGGKSIFVSVITGNHLAAFGADEDHCGELGQIEVDEDGNKYRDGYCSLTKNSVEVARLVVRQTLGQELIDLKVQPTISSQ